jgi:hypothetical protein
VSKSFKKGGNETIRADKRVRAEQARKEKKVLKVKNYNYADKEDIDEDEFD